MLSSKLINSENLSIINTVGNFSIKNDTGFTATATAGANTYQVGIKRLLLIYLGSR